MIIYICFLSAKLDSHAMRVWQYAIYAFGEGLVPKRSF